MRTIRCSLFLALFALDAAAQDDATAPQPVRRADTSIAAHAQATFVGVAKRALPSIVCVRAFERVDAEVAPTDASGPHWVDTELPEYPGFRLFSAGSGFIIDGNGDILTCTHVLQKADGTYADLIDVELADATRVICEVVGTEPTVNLAILQPMVFPNGHSKRLPALSFGDSDVVEIGEWVIAIGDPYGPAKYFSVGSFVAQPSRDCYQDFLSAFFMQVALVAHPEAYGGPLLDLDGKVIGVLAPRHPKPGGKTSEPRYGIEYGMPGKIVQGLYEAIRVARSTRSPWLGCSVMSRPEIAKVHGIEAFTAMDKPRAGILIENVFDPSQAKHAGIRPGDWLTGFGATRIFTPVDFQKSLYLAGIGSRVQLEIYRDGETKVVELLVEERPPEAKPR